MTGTLVAHLVRGEDDRVRFAADLDTAEACAGAAAEPRAVRLRVGTPVGTLPEWCEDLNRSRPDRVLFVPGPETGELAGLLAGRMRGLGVPATASAAPPPARTGAAARVYRDGVLRPAHAAEAGLRVGGRDTGAVLAELDHVVRGATGPLVLPLLDGTAAEWHPGSPLVDGLAARSARLARAGVTPSAAVAAGDLTDRVLAGLRQAGTGPPALRVRPSEVDAPALRAALARAAAAGTRATVEILDAGDDPVAVAGLLRVAPDAVLHAPPGALLRLAGQGALRGVPPQAAVAVRLRRYRRLGAARVHRAGTGSYSSGPISAGVHDLCWEHRAPVAAHAAWVGAVTASGGSVQVYTGPRGGTVAHLPVLRAEQPLGYAGAGTHPEEPRVLDLRSETDTDALLADLDAAWYEGKLAGRLFDPSHSLADLCVLGAADCTEGGGRRLHVDASGAVLAHRGGPPVGRVGDELDTLRRNLRALGTSGRRCTRRVVRRPEWLHRVLDAKQAVAAFCRADSTVDAPDDELRISGCGGPIYHDRGSAPHWPSGVVLLRHRDRPLLFAAGGLAALTDPLAWLIELHLDLGAAAVDATAPRLGVDAAAEALARAAHTLGRLTGDPERSTEEVAA